MQVSSRTPYPILSWDSLALLQGDLGPSGPKWQKSPKWAPAAKKRPKRSRKWVKISYDREEKSIHHHRGDPPFFLFPSLRLYGVYGVYPSFRTYGVYPFPLFSQEIGIHHSFLLLCDLGVGRPTEKRGVPRWWCILFFALVPPAYAHSSQASISRTPNQLSEISLPVFSLIFLKHLLRQLFASKVILFL